MSDFDSTFLAFIAQRELRVPRCARTGEALSYAARLCADSTEIEWVKASGAATLYSFAVYRRQYSPDFPVPYNVALVELAEGPRLVSTVIIEDPAALRIDMKLLADFDAAGKLVFKPA
jgi:uncharacterized OB-fold protein